MRLGEILIERGFVTVDELRSGLDACRRHGGRLGTWLVRLGILNEAKLLQALSEQSGVPSVTALELASAPSELRALLPASLARRHLVMAFGRRGKVLDVAMANPGDLVVRDEIASLTGMVVRPHVATEAALTAALAIPFPAPAAATAPPPGPPRGAAREWRQFWRLESTPPELFRALADGGAEPVACSVATFPALLPRGEPTAGEQVDLDQLSDALAAVTHRDQVAELTLSYLSTLAPRVAFFSLHQGRVLGWAVRSEWTVEEDFHTLILPLDRPSVFLNLSKGVDLHNGPVASGEGNELLFEALGPPKPETALIVPVRVRGRPAAFLWLDAGSAGTADLPVPAVREAARLAGLALEVLVLRQKLRGGARLTETGSER